MRYRYVKEPFTTKSGIKIEPGDECVKVPPPYGGEDLEPPGLTLVCFAKAPDKTFYVKRRDIKPLKY